VREGRASTLVVTAAVLWGTTGTAQALGNAQGSPLSVGALRMAIGAAGLLAVSWRRISPPPPGWFGLSAVCMAGYQVCFFSGVARVGVALGTVVALGSAPVLAGLLGRVIRREVLTPRWIMATASAVAGVALIAAAPGDADPLGVALALGAGLAYAVYALSSKYLVETLHPTAAMALTFAFAAVLLAPLMLGADLAWLAHPRGLAAAVWLGLGATTLAYIAFARGLRGTQVANAATLTLAEPATAVVLGFVVLGERPGWAGWAGVVLVMGAVWLLAGARRAAVSP
jgi:DME family drug/metabolite transporter